MRGSALVVPTVLFASLVCGQNTGEPATDRALTLARVDGPIAFQEIINVIRAMTAITQITPDRQQNTLEVRGTPDQIGLAEWLANQLGGPAGNTAATEYQVPGGKDAARVFYLSHIAGPKDLQEVINAIRSVCDLARVMPVNAQRAVVLRGPTENIRLAAWIISELDRAPNSPPPTQEVHEFRPAVAANEVARVFYPQGSADLQTIVNAVRTALKIYRIYPNQAVRAIVLRAANDEVAEAARIVDTLGR